MKPFLAQQLMSSSLAPRHVSRPFGVICRNRPSEFRRNFATNASTTQKRGSEGFKQSVWKQTIATAGLCGAVLSGYHWLSNRTASQQIAVSETTSIGTPKLGGSWTLTDHNGKRVSDTDFLGKYQLLYFGFTFCPDVCPEELEKQAEVIEILDKKYGEVVQPIMITVDPQRDDPAKLKEYCEEFHPRLLGCTGTPEEIKHVSRLYRVFFNRGLKTSEEDYLIDHSIIHYFVGKKGKFKDFFGKNMTVPEIVNKLSSMIDEDIRNEKKRGAIEDVK